jgi:hypothetical protein
LRSFTEENRALTPTILWAAIAGLILGLVYLIRRVLRRGEKESSFDVGMAIMQFGRAFPGEAIRDLHGTADGNAIFVRLHDGKAGIMRNRSNHFACHLIKPGRVRITPSADAKGFSAIFLDAPTQNSDFVFRNENEAADVSLWLLDNLVSQSDMSMEQPEVRAAADLSKPDLAR